MIQCGTTAFVATGWAVLVLQDPVLAPQLLQLAIPQLPFAIAGDGMVFEQQAEQCLAIVADFLGVRLYLLAVLADPRTARSQRAFASCFARRFSSRTAFVLRTCPRSISASRGQFN